MARGKNKDAPSPEVITPLLAPPGPNTPLCGKGGELFDALKVEGYGQNEVPTHRSEQYPISR